MDMYSWLEQGRTNVYKTVKCCYKVLNYHLAPKDTASGTLPGFDSLEIFIPHHLL